MKTILLFLALSCVLCCSILAAFALVGSWAGIGSPGGCGA